MDIFIFVSSWFENKTELNDRSTIKKTIRSTYNLISSLVCIFKTEC